MNDPTANSRGNSVVNAERMYKGNTFKKSKAMQTDLVGNVSPNCCLLEICNVQVTKTATKDIVFLGTYDGTLFALFLDTYISD